MIVTEAELRHFLGLEETMSATEHAILQTVHGRAESLVINHLKYNPEQGTHTEFYPRADPIGGMGFRDNDFFDGTWESNGVTIRPVRPGNGISRTLQLEHIPVRTISKLFVSPGAYFGQANQSTFDDTFDFTFQDSAGVANLRTLGVDYWLDLEKEKFSATGCVYERGLWPIEPGSISVTYVSGYSHAELAGRADAEAAVADEARGIITCPWVNAAGISHAINLTVLKLMHEQQAFRKDDNNGFGGGTGFESERFQDYEYKRPGGAVAQLTGLVAGLPTEALEALEPYMHYGIQRL